MTYSLDRNVLEQFLMSDAVARDSMGPHELDGYLTGLAAGPETVPYLEWSELVWGSGKPCYSSSSQERLIVGLIQGRYKKVLLALRDPCVDGAEFFCGKCEDRSLMASIWADGFLQAMELRAEGWLPLLRNELAGVNLVPLLALFRGLADDYDLPFSPCLKQAMMLAAADMVAPCVRRIRKYWDEHPTSRRLRDWG